MTYTLLDKSIDKLHSNKNNKFSLKTVLLLATDMISRLQFLHSKGYIHRFFNIVHYFLFKKKINNYYYYKRDIKPDNFMIGRGELSSLIYLIDFGLAKKYLDSEGKHI